MKNNPWAVRIDYDKEIANDQASIAFYSSPLAIEVARLCEGAAAACEPTKADTTAHDWCFADMSNLLDVFPAVATFFGLSNDDARALLAYFESDGSKPNPFGEAQRGDYARGANLCSQAVPNPRWARDTLGEFRTFTETCPKHGRAALLKKAKIDLSRHTRNKAKWRG